MRRLVLAAALAALGVSTAAIAAADPAKVIAERKANLKKMGGAFKLIMGQARSGKLDPAGVAATGELKTLSAKLDNWFPAGSGPDADSSTRAKLEVWKNRADFTAKAKALAAATSELQAAAAAGGDVQAAGYKVGGTCKACHDSYREAY